MRTFTPSFPLENLRLREKEAKESWQSMAAIGEVEPKTLWLLAS